MKTFKSIIAPAVVLVISLFLFAACSQDDSDSKQVSWDDFIFSGVFTGNYTNNSSSELEGYITIEDNGIISIELFNGGMVGTVDEEGEDYNISINQSSGIFGNVSNITGTLNSVTRMIAISGTDMTGSSVTITGEVPPVPINFSNSLSKSTILFTHSEMDCVASVTVNGVTLSGLQHFYEDNNFCHSKYDIFRILVRDNDTAESKVHCNTGTILGLDGNPLTFTQCAVMRFVVNKNTEYTYTVNWNNGEVTTGQFKSPDGGRFITICPTSDDCTGGGGAGNETGTGQFNFNGITYNAICASTPGSSCAGSGIDVVLVPKGGDNTFIIYNMPVANGGSYPFADGEEAVNTCNLYGILNGSSNLYVTESGSLTKTGANSFTFTSVIRNITSGGTTTLEGSGSY